MDTRSGLGGNAFSAGETRQLTVVGVGPVPATEVTAVALNVTVTGATKESHLTVFPGGTKPTASSINFRAGQTIANSVTVGVFGTTVSIFNNVGSAQVIVDIQGWYVDGLTWDPAGFHPTTPTRLMDTRVGAGGGRFAPNETRELPVGFVEYGTVGDVATAALNITITGPSGPGHLTVWPSGNPEPTASNLNYASGETIANAVTVGVGDNGRISLHVPATTSVDVIVDLDGFYTRPPASTGGFTSIQPLRRLDTRQPGGGGSFGPGESRSLNVTGFGGIPAKGVAAVVLNLTATNATSDTHMTLWPGGTPKPVASNLNLPAGATRPNQVTVAVSTNGQISLFNNAGRSDLIVDVAGWFEGTPAAGDTAGPLISMTAPSDGSTVDASSTGELALSGTASDTETGIASIAIAVDGQAAGTAAFDSTTNPPRWRTTLSATAGGLHLVTATATDRSGKQTSASSHVTITPPATGAAAASPRARSLAAMSSHLAGYDSISGVATFGPGDAAALAPNDFLVGGPSDRTPSGLLRRVGSVLITPGGIVVQTVPAAMGEVFRQVSISVDEDLPALTGGGFDRTLDHRSAVAGAGGTVRVTGHVTGTGHVTADVKISPSGGWSAPVAPSTVEHASATGSFDQQADYHATPSVPLSGKIDNDVVDTAKVVDVVDTMAAGLPMVLPVGLEVTSTLSLDGALAAAADMHLTDHAGAGVDWTRGGATTPTGHGSGTAAPNVAPTTITDDTDISFRTTTAAMVGLYDMPGMTYTSAPTARFQAGPSTYAPINALPWTFKALGSSQLSFPLQSFEVGYNTLTAFSASTVDAASGSTFVPPVNPIALNIGDTFTATMTNGTGPVYRFTGSAGQLVNLAHEASSFGSFSGVHLSIVDDAGHGVFHGKDLFEWPANEQTKLPKNGVYYLAVTPGSSTGSGTVVVHLTTPVVDPTPIALNDTNGRFLDSGATGRAHLLTFSGTAGDQLSAYFLSYQVMTITAPDGTLLPSGTPLAPNGFTLPMSGTYVVDIFPAQPTINATTLWLSVPTTDPTPLAVDDPAGRAITLDVPAQTKKVTFSATAGEALSVVAAITLGTAPWGAGACVTPPSGGTPTCGMFGQSFPVAINETGVWTLSTASNSYAVAHVYVSHPVHDTLTMNSAAGTAVTSALPGQGHTISFSGTQGQSVTLVFKSTNPWFDSLALKNPDGSYGYAFGTIWADSNGTRARYEGVLPATGTYVLELNPKNTATGTTSFWLSTPLDDPTPLAFDDANGRSFDLSVPGRHAVMRYTGAVGDDVTLAIAGPGDGQIDVSVTDPGTQPSSVWPPQPPCQRRTLAVAGTYTVDVILPPQDAGTVKVWISHPRANGAVTPDSGTKIVDASVPCQLHEVDVPVANASSLHLATPTFGGSITSVQMTFWASPSNGTYWTSTAGTSVVRNVTPQTMARLEFVTTAATPGSVSLLLTTP